jgi:hypothetical protein
LFSPNQNYISSDFHRAVWWWAVGLVPVTESLPGIVMPVENRPVGAETDLKPYRHDWVQAYGPEVRDGCLEWRDYFDALCADMYQNASAYAPASPRQYRDILEHIAAGGQLLGDSLFMDEAVFNAYREKINRSKGYVSKRITWDGAAAALARKGLRYEIRGGEAVFYMEGYAHIFYAMQAFERSAGIRETTARHHFAHCEFRQIPKPYECDYAGHMRRASDESKTVLAAIHEYCAGQKIKRFLHFGIAKYKYNGVRILDYNLYGDDYPTLRLNIGSYRINPYAKDIPDILRRVAERKSEIDRMGAASFDA